MDKDLFSYEHHFPVSYISGNSDRRGLAELLTDDEVGQFNNNFIFPVEHRSITDAIGPSEKLAPALGRTGAIAVKVERVAQGRSLPTAAEVGEQRPKTFEVRSGRST